MEIRLSRVKTIRIPTGLLLLFLGLIQGCAVFDSAPKVEIVQLGLVSLGLSSGTAEVTLDVTNVGGRQLQIRGLRYEVRVPDPSGGDWIDLAQDFHQEDLVVAGGETVRVKVPVPFEYSALGAAVRSFLSSGEVPYRIEGSVLVGGSGMVLQVPFRHEGIIGS